MSTESFTLTISEEARQTASRFFDNCSCLIATELKLHGFREVTEYSWGAICDGEAYTHPTATSSLLMFDYSRTEPPYYDAGVVGREFVFKRMGA